MRLPPIVTYYSVAPLFMVGYLTTYTGVVLDQLLVIYFGLSLCVPMLLGCGFALAFRRQFPLGKLVFFAIWFVLSSPLALARLPEALLGWNPLLICCPPLLLSLPLLPDQNARQTTSPHLWTQTQAIDMHPLWDRDLDG